MDTAISYTPNKSNLTLTSISDSAEKGAQPQQMIRVRGTGVARTAVAAASLIGIFSGLSLNMSEGTLSGTGSLMALHASPKLISQHLAVSYEEMRSYLSLVDGWDGPGSISPSKLTINIALSFLGALPKLASPPEAGATADGYAEWYWRSNVGVATVSFKGSRMAYYARAGAGHPVQDTVVFDGISIPADLGRVLIKI